MLGHLAHFGNKGRVQIRPPSCTGRSLRMGPIESQLRDARHLHRAHQQLQRSHHVSLQPQPPCELCRLNVRCVIIVTVVLLAEGGSGEAKARPGDTRNRITAVFVGNDCCQALTEIMLPLKQKTCRNRTVSLYGLPKAMHASICYSYFEGKINKKIPD